MRRSPNEPPIENLCVYCSSSQSFSYMRKCNAEGSSRGASSNEYQRTVLKKAVNYKWVKDLTCDECLLSVMESLQKEGRAERLRGACRRRDEHAGGASPMVAGTLGGETRTVNRRFLKNERRMGEAKSLERRSRRGFKPRAFADGGNQAGKSNEVKEAGEADEVNESNEAGQADKSREAARLFDAAARAKHYRRASKAWLRRFLRKSGPVYKQQAKKIITFLIIKNFKIFDVELWNSFFKRKAANQMNTNLYLLFGREGSQREKFLEDVFRSFPFFYASDRVFMVDLGQYGRSPIVSDCGYAVHSMGGSSMQRTAQGEARKGRPYVEKVLYPNLSQLTQKEEAVRGLTQRRGGLQNIDPCNENLEYILLAVTRIALVKQFVWKKQLLRGVSGLVESSQLGRRLARRGEEAPRKSPRMVEMVEMAKAGKRASGLNLFNGGPSFLLIKNLDKLTDLGMPPLRRSCIVQVLLKYVFLWRELNLNVHAFVLAPQQLAGLAAGGAAGVAAGGVPNPLGVNPLSELLSNCATFEFPAFELPPFLREAQRRQYLAHLFKEKGVKCPKGDLQRVAQMTTSFSKADLEKLCRDECRERFNHAVRGGGGLPQMSGLPSMGGLPSVDELPSVGGLPNLLDHPKLLRARGGAPPEGNFFHKTLNLQSESHAVIRTHEVELYTGEKRGHSDGGHPKSGTNSGEPHGLDGVIAEEELVGKLRSEVLRRFKANPTCEKGPPGRARPAEPPTGILLHGKSGSGKTFLAQRLIDECNCTSILINCSQVFNKIMGESEKFLNDIFVYAGGRVGPCVILFDGIETICCSVRGSSSHGVSKFTERLKLCFYQHLDRIHFQNKWVMERGTTGKVLIVATTTELTNVDSNLLVDHRLRHVFRTKEFHLWRDSDVLKLLHSCLQRFNVHADRLVLSFEFEHFFRECILRRKGRLTPLCVSNLCRDAVARRVRRALACAGRDPNDGISVQDLLWAAKRANG
ncbi:AAA family ATPase, putative [Plasmodium vivax]|uniref:AAA family ATPase, putative n=1 Tax=Plasmodium vivax TaxID=5855 RepID=A0A1G4H6H2_PLAVI|nr:AAA family ATPase, putative [Plasmodium vivax]